MLISWLGFWGEYLNWSCNIKNSEGSQQSSSQWQKMLRVRPMIKEMVEIPKIKIDARGERQLGEEEMHQERNAQFEF